MLIFVINIERIFTEIVYRYSTRISVMFRHRTWSTLAQITDWRPTVSSHYLKLCWLIISDHHLRATWQEIPHPSITQIMLNIIDFNFYSSLTEAKELCPRTCLSMIPSAGTQLRSHLPIGKTRGCPWISSHKVARSTSPIARTLPQPPIHHTAIKASPGYHLLPMAVITFFLLYLMWPSTSRQEFDWNQ